MPNIEVLYTRHYRVPVYLTDKNRGHPTFPDDCVRYIKNVGFKDDFLQHGKWQPEPTGGATIVIVEDTKTKQRTFGIARCSVKDNFCYQRGRDIAIGRAKRKLECQK